MVTLKSNLIIPETVYFQQLDNEAVLLESVSGKYFSLNPIGAQAWNLLVEGNSLESVFQILMAEYEVEAERLQSDLLSLMEKLAEKGLVQVVE